MQSDSPGSQDQLRADLAAAHTKRFGSRADEALTAAIDTTSWAVAMVADQTLGAYDSEPDFITGSSEKEPTA